jgi:hypothetical protein
MVVLRYTDDRKDQRPYNSINYGSHLLSICVHWTTDHRSAVCPLSARLLKWLPMGLPDQK